jgi:hypothetical protein
MPIQITIPDKKICRVYWPKELKDSGFKGDLKIYEAVCVLAIPKPDAREQDIAKGLELLAEEFKYRAKIKEHESQKSS